eukprot:3068521-Prymnesium_polylepis.1
MKTDDDVGEPRAAVLKGRSLHIPPHQLRARYRGAGAVDGRAGRQLHAARPYSLPGGLFLPCSSHRCSFTCGRNRRRNRNTNRNTC